MARKLEADIQDLVRRAQDEVSERDHRYVYSNGPSTSRSDYAVRQNKKAVARRISTFYLVILLLCFGVAIVAYINNIIVVNRLSAEVSLLQTKLDKTSNGNAVLRAEINRKSGWERIGNIATERLGMKYPKEQPVMLDVEEDMVDRITKDTLAR